MLEKIQSTATLFGKYLDEDNFEAVKKLLETNCEYFIHDKKIISKETIVNSYSKNQKEGKAKFDKMIWGKSYIEKITDHQFEVFFSDHLTHKGITHNYKCKQKLFINSNFLIEKIIHQELLGQREKLEAFYKKVEL